MQKSGAEIIAHKEKQKVYLIKKVNINTIWNRKERYRIVPK